MIYIYKNLSYSGSKDWVRMIFSSSPALDKIVEPLLQSREIHVLGEVRLGQREVPHEVLEQRILLVNRLDLPAIVVTVSPVDLRPRNEPVERI